MFKKIVGFLIIVPILGLALVGAGCNASTDPQTGGSVAVSITYSGNKFFPMIVTVKAGDKVIFKNDSNEAIQIQSNPHPIHTDNVELNIGLLAPGQSRTVILNNKGVWGYHNHLNPIQVGSIIVQ
jgi:plastocyanin